MNSVDGTLTWLPCHIHISTECKLIGFFFSVCHNVVLWSDHTRFAGRVEGASEGGQEYDPEAVPSRPRVQAVCINGAGDLQADDAGAGGMVAGDAGAGGLEANDAGAGTRRTHDRP
ncbi:hypothetical protein CRENBAI_016872 [Crenichthys baileyi]|uniref:Uncharacterized protein n=1 Tax=Crenichthys baileyi TaxID=28760 RepID=A0AAV9S4C9_9TELE